MKEERYVWYILRRIIGTIPTILFIITVSFFFIHLAPGNPILYLAGRVPVSEEFIIMMEHRFGLDKPLHVQYLDYMGKILLGDFGFSYIRNMPVLGLILERIPATVLLLGASYSIFSIIAVFLGVLTSTKSGSLGDNALTAVALFGYCMPGFWLGIMSLYILGFKLAWFPIGGQTTLGAELVGLDYVIDVLRHLVLPVSVLGFWCLALFFRITRQSMLETLQEDFIVTARSKGLNEKAVLFRHALKNSLRPIVTLFGLRAGKIVGGAIITESVFAWPGMGRLMYEAVMTRDYPLLLGSFIFLSISMITANLVADLVYAFIDPRVRYH